MLTSIFQFFAINKIIIMVVAGITIFLSAFGYYWYTTAKIDRLENDNMLLTMQNDSLTKTMKALQVDYNNIIASRDSLTKEVSKAKDAKKKIEDSLYRENRKKKSLEELALKKTSLIQKLVNKATENVFNCFVLISKGGDC